MFTHDLDATASYRTIARGFGCGWARAYANSQHGYGHRYGGEGPAPRREPGRARHSGGSAERVAPISRRRGTQR